MAMNPGYFIHMAQSIITVIKAPDKKFSKAPLFQSRAIKRLLTLFALRKAKIAHNFGLSECNRVKVK